MKVLWTYRPTNNDNMVITSSPTKAGFGVENLKNIQPTKSLKTMNTTGDKWIKYDAGYGNKFNINAVFLNRFNFSNFKIQGSDDDFTTIPYDVLISGVTRDEIYDPNNVEIVSDNYMHYWFEPQNFNYRYFRLYIPSQVPLFEIDTFKIGNLLIGNYTEIWNPQSGFKITIIPNIKVTTFSSGYETYYKLGKFFRTFEGVLDKIHINEYNKIIKSVNPFVLYLDYENDNTKAYLVKTSKELSREYYLSNYVTVPISFREVV